MARTTQFYDLQPLLERDGYRVEFWPEDLDGGDRIRVLGNGIVAFASVWISWYGKYAGNRIAADNAECFDKWSRCPLVMEFPLDYDELLKHLKWLATPAGYEYSNSFGKGELPCEIDK
jgi:hypothetical protein